VYSKAWSSFFKSIPAVFLIAEASFNVRQPPSLSGFGKYSSAGATDAAVKANTANKSEARIRIICVWLCMVLEKK
jgi:hypothetical protein